MSDDLRGLVPLSQPAIEKLEAIYDEERELSGFDYAQILEALKRLALYERRVPALLDEVERARAEIVELQKSCGRAWEDAGRKTIEICNLDGKISDLTDENTGLRETNNHLCDENMKLQKDTARLTARVAELEARCSAAEGDLRMVCTAGEVCASCHWCCDKGPDFPCSKHDEWCKGESWKWRDLKNGG